MYPTEQAVKQKERLRQIKQEGLSPRKKMQIVEQIYQDCGEDLSSLLLHTEVVPWSAYLLSSLEEDEMPDEWNATIEHVYASLQGVENQFHGSGCSIPKSQVTAKGVCSIRQLGAMFSNELSQAQVHLVELFGGKGRTSYMLTRGFDMASGQNFDAVTGFDLTDSKDVAALKCYLLKVRPTVVLMGPPCRAFGPMSRINRVLHPDGYAASRYEGEVFARLCYDIACWQLQNQRHFLIEQPAGSELYQLPEWSSLRPMCVQCIFDQCQVGLKSPKPPHLPIRKRTELWASHETLVHRFRSKQCAGTHAHAGVSSISDRANGVPSQVCQEWPRDMCRIFASAIADLVLGSSVSFPTVDTRSMVCPGCRWHKRKEDPSHTRVDDCMHKNVEPKVWECPACQSNKPRVHEEHRLDKTCQWSVSRDMPAGASRERRRGDVRIPAAREPTSEARLDSGPGPSRAKPRDESHAPAARRRDTAVQVVNGGLGGEPGSVASSSARPSRSSGRVASPSRDIAPPAAAGRAADRAPPDAAGRAASSREGDAPIAGDAAAAVGPSAPRAEREAAAASSPPEAVPPIEEAPPAQSEEAWTRFDLGRALQKLRSLNEAVVRRALRQLHVRFYHPSTQRLRGLLAAAGVEPQVLEMVAQITDTCGICRSWTRPGAKAIMSTNLPTMFNEEVQIDLLFILDKVIFHMVDVCTRFCVATVIPNKLTDTLLECIQKHWLSLFGPPMAIVSDQEGGLASPAAAAWMSHRNIKFVPKARYAHANVVERHHALLRHQFHLLRDQTMADGIKASFEAILSECVYVKNAMMRIGNASPYEAVIGRVPHLFDVVDAESGPDIEAKDADRLRAKSIQAMVQATAAAKLERATKHKTRVTGELLELSVGEQVDFWRQPATKDHSGWLGPATVVDVSTLTQGHITIRFQGKAMLCRVQDLRRSLMYTVLMTHEPVSTPVGVIRHAAESLDRQVVRLGWFRQQGVWQSFENNARLPVEVIAGLHMAACNLQFNGVISFRLGNSVPTLAGVECDESLLLMWDKGHLDAWSVAYIPGSCSVNFERMLGRKCNDVAFVQFFAVDAETVLSLRQHVQDIPNIGGISDPQLPRVQDITSAVMQNRRQRAIENARATDQVGPEEFDIGTPRESHSDATVQSASESSDTFEPTADEDEWYQFLTRPPEVCRHNVGSNIYIFNVSELLDEPLQIEFTSQAAKYLVCFRDSVKEDETVSMNFEAPLNPVIERANNILTRQEALENVERCRKAMIKELLRWNTHRAWRRGPRATATNALSSKWVLKWKMIEGTREIKARLVVQGFKDVQAVQNFAGTTSRWGQRLVLITSVQFGWGLTSADVAEAFLRGLTFRELFENGEDAVLRDVQLILPPGSAELIQAIPGLESFNCDREVLYLLKPGFGLKDAPRLWALALKRVLAQLELRPLQADAQLFAKHSNGKLLALLSIHVDDLKITGNDSERAAIIRGLEKEFDQLKVENDCFEHLGLKHSLESDGTRVLSQQHYIAELRPIPDADLKLMQPEAEVSPEIARLYMSLLGGVAWTTQTRPDVAVFVSALQRRLKAPRVQDVANLNRVLKYLKLKPLCLRYKKVPRPWRLVVVTDSSFKGEGQEHLAVRSGVIALVDRDGPFTGTNSIQLLDFVSKKQSRVCRSTYAAELLSALDIAGAAMQINSAMSELLQGCMSASQLLSKQESMTHALQLDVILDAFSVWTSACAEDVKCTDGAMMLHLLAFRELLGRGISRLIWVDTRDMLADALNKGAIDRSAIRTACADAVWHISQEIKIHVCKTRVTAQRSDNADRGAKL